MPSANVNEQRDDAIFNKFQALYREGMKKNYVYRLLAKEYGVQAERIAEIVILRDLECDIREGQFKNQADHPPPYTPVKLLYTQARHLNSPPERDVKKKNKRDEDIIKRFRQIYREGMKKYYVYQILAEEFDLLTKSIAEIVTQSNRRWGLNGGKFKCKEDQLAYFREKYKRKGRKRK